MRIETVEIVPAADHCPGDPTRIYFFGAPDAEITPADLGGNLFDELRVVLRETQQAVMPENASGQFFRHSVGGDQTVLGYRCDRTVFTSSLVPVSAIFVDIARA